VLKFHFHTVSQKQVNLFKEEKRLFDLERQKIPEELQADLAFEFQAYMHQRIIEAQQEMSRENNFTFDGEEATNQAGHIANMSNQLRALLYSIRLETLQHAAQDHGINDLRKCPHCGQVWAKLVGCDGATTCGQMIGGADSRRNGVMATFTFQFRTDTQANSFTISQSGEKKAKIREGTEKIGNAGCGNTINWKAMKPVPVPEEFLEGAIGVSTKDVDVLPKEAGNVKAKIASFLNMGVKKENIHVNKK